MYFILRLLLKMTIAVFFRKRVISYLERIPKEGPLIIVANHPCTFLDPIIIACYCNRPVYFLAKGAIFKNKLAAKILSILHIIPVFRQADDPSMMHKNAETFSKCYEHLERNGVILLFPEGISVTEKKLKPIKTGAARIALGAEARNGFKLGVKIVPIGLDYENPHQFGKNVFVNVGLPISVADYKDQFELNNRKTVGVITDWITDNLDELTINLLSKKEEEILKSIEVLYLTENKKDTSFGFSKKAAEIIHFYARNHIVKFHFLSSRINSYFNMKEKIGLDDVSIDGNSEFWLWRVIKYAVFIILGAPIFIFGFINNALPYYLSPVLTSKINNQLEYKGPISMVLGMFMYLILYPIILLIFYYYTQSGFLTIAYGLILPLSGLFTYEYVQVIKSLKQRISFISIFYNKTKLMSNLLREREELIKMLEDVQSEYETEVLISAI
ncbi:MAG: glycerol-3-phosphate O-acyltransferase/dihydroxyacetone phosphate acyltransferase [Parvicella sp.]|jgi:glycerol-3-phosphate O-acyltransferase/dihydroxyacetone phosphate acyltransferase